MLQNRINTLLNPFISRVNLYVACSATICLAVLFGIGVLYNPLIALGSLLGILTVSAFLFRPKETLIGFLIIRSSVDVFYDIKLFGILNIAGVLSILLIVCGTIILLNHHSSLKRKVYVYLIIFLITTLISSLLSDNAIFSLTQWARLCSSFMVIPLVTVLFVDSKSRYNLFKFLLLAMAVPLIFGMMQLLTKSAVDKTGFNRIYGTFVHTGGFGEFLLIFFSAYIVYFIGKKYFINKYILMAILGIILVLLMLTYQRGVWIGLFIVFMVFGVIKYRRILFIVPIIIVLLVFFAPSLTERTKDLYDEDSYGRYSKNSFYARLDIWNRTLQGALEKQILGHGFGSGRIYAGTQQHNDYLKVFFEAGILGIFIFFLIISSFLYISYQFYTKYPDTWEHPLALGIFSLLIACLVMMIARNFIGKPMIWWYLSAYIGILLSATNEYCVASSNGKRTQ